MSTSLSPSLSTQTYCFDTCDCWVMKNNGIFWSMGSRVTHILTLGSLEAEWKPQCNVWQCSSSMSLCFSHLLEEKFEGRWQKVMEFHYYIVMQMNHPPHFNICEQSSSSSQTKRMRFCSSCLASVHMLPGIFRTTYINSKYYFYSKEGNISLLIFSKRCVVTTKI